jgi:hypothetical protein
MQYCGIDAKRLHDQEIPAAERAHYSKRTVDIEFDYPFGRKELYGLAYRTDFDLSQHAKHSGKDLLYTDPVSGEKYVPHVIEPTFGVNRTFLVMLLSAYTEEQVAKAKRVWSCVCPKPLRRLRSLSCRCPRKKSCRAWPSLWPKSWPSSGGWTTTKRKASANVTAAKTKSARRIVLLLTSIRSMTKA